MKASILISIPDVIVRSSLGKYLRDCGYLVLEVASADEAVTVLSSGKDVCCVLASVDDNAAFNGFELARWVREHTPGTKVLLAASLKAAAGRAAELCRQQHDIIDHPLDPQIIVDRIQQMLSSRSRRPQQHDL